MSEAQEAAALLNQGAQAVFGLVSAVDPVNHAVKVKIQPDGVETGWIPDIGGVQAGDLRIARPSAAGTHVLLLPVGGDGEHLVALGSAFDTVVKPPVSPVDGKAVPAGAFLVKAGCGAPPTDADGSVGQTTDQAGWCLIGLDGVSLGAGNALLTLADGKITLTVGSVSAVLSGSGLKVTGGDVSTEEHSLDSHVHGEVKAGGDQTGGPVG